MLTRVGTSAYHSTDGCLHDMTCSASFPTSIGLQRLASKKKEGNGGTWEAGGG